MTLEEALNKAAAELPNRLKALLVEATQGRICVHVLDWDGYPINRARTEGDTLADQVLAGLQWCKDTSPNDEDEE